MNLKKASKILSLAAALICIPLPSHATISEEMVEQIKKDEGVRTRAYLDSLGVLTIGVGFNLEQKNAVHILINAGVSLDDLERVMKVGGKPLTDEQVENLFQISLKQAEQDAKALFKGYSEAPQRVKDVWVTMSYQMGKTRLRGFKRLLEALESEDWVTAQKEMLDSLWARQTPHKAERLAKRLID